MKKRLLSLLLAVLMIFSMLPVSVLADDVGEPQGEPSTDVGQPEAAPETPVEPKHEHKYTYKSNGDGSHTATCSCGDSYTEPCELDEEYLGGIRCAVCKADLSAFAPESTTLDTPTTDIGTFTPAPSSSPALSDEILSTLNVEVVSDYSDPYSMPLTAGKNGTNYTVTSTGSNTFTIKITNPSAYYKTNYSDGNTKHNQVEMSVSVEDGKIKIYSPTKFILYAKYEPDNVSRDRAIKAVEVTVHCDQVTHRKADATYKVGKNISSTKVTNNPGTDSYTCTVILDSPENFATEYSETSDATHTYVADGSITSFTMEWKKVDGTWGWHLASEAPKVIVKCDKPDLPGWDDIKKFPASGSAVSLVCKTSTSHKASYANLTIGNQISWGSVTKNTGSDAAAYPWKCEITVNANWFLKNYNEGAGHREHKLVTSGNKTLTWLYSTETGWVCNDEPVVIEIEDVEPFPIYVYITPVDSTGKSIKLSNDLLEKYELTDNNGNAGGSQWFNVGKLTTSLVLPDPADYPTNGTYVYISASQLETLKSELKTSNLSHDSVNKLFSGSFFDNVTFSALKVEEEHQNDAPKSKAYHFDGTLAFYNVKFDTNAGTDTVGGTVPADGYYYNGEQIKLPALTREGYTFLGWSVNTESTEYLSASYTVNADVKLIANWKKNIPDAPKSLSLNGLKPVKLVCSTDASHGTFVDLIAGTYTLSEPAWNEAGWYEYTVTITNASSYVTAPHKLAGTANVGKIKAVPPKSDNGGWTISAITTITIPVICKPAAPTIPASDLKQLVKVCLDCSTYPDHDKTVDLIDGTYTLGEPTWDAETWVYTYTVTLTDTSAYLEGGHKLDGEATVGTLTAKAPVKADGTYNPYGSFELAGTNITLPVKCQPDAPTLYHVNIAPAVKVDVNCASGCTHETCELIAGTYETSYVWNEAEWRYDYTVTITNPEAYYPANHIADGELTAGSFTVRFDGTTNHVENGKNAAVSVKLNTFTVKFYPAGGQDAEGGHNVSWTETITYGSTIDFVTLTQAGYEFVGWFIDNDPTKEFKATDTVKSELELYAHWDKLYTLTYDANTEDATVSGIPASVTQKSTVFTVSTDKPTRTGYTFLGWSDGADGKIITTTTISISASTTLYAQWQANTYTVTFDANGGEGTMEPQAFIYDDAQNLSKNTFTREHYKFLGWSETADGEVKYADEAEVKNLTVEANGNVTLFAQWESQLFTIAFNGNGGVLTNNNEKTRSTSNAYIGEEATLKNAKTFTRTGYTFQGWATSADGEVVYTGSQKVTFPDEIFSEVKPGDTIELYAIWTANTYTVEFNANGGSGSMASLTLTYDEAKALTKNNFARTGYYFAGWNTAADGTGESYTDEQEVLNLTAENGATITLYAQWTIRTDITYTVHYYKKGTDKSLKDDKVVTGQTFGTTVTEEAASISGWRLVGDKKQELTLAESGNEITFEYVRKTSSSSSSSSSTSKKEPTLQFNTADHDAYIKGYPDGTVRPQGTITRAEVATILYRIMDEDCREAYYTTKNSFYDVNSSKWYNTYVSTLAKAGVIVDSSNGYFRPDEAITRAELAVMMAQFTSTTASTNNFSDVSKYHWAADEIAVAEKMGWIKGYPDGTFRPDATITRAEMVTMINRALGRLPSSEDRLVSVYKMTTFPDCTPNDWFYLAVQEAANAHTYRTIGKNGDEEWISIVK